MNLEKLNQQFKPIYQKNPDAVNLYVKATARLVWEAMDRQTGVCSYDVLFDEVRPAMPSGADVGINAALADGLLRLMIQQTVDRRSQWAPNELAMLDRITETMKEHGFKTAGEAIEFLRKQQLN